MSEPARKKRILKKMEVALIRLVADNDVTLTPKVMKAAERVRLAQILYLKGQYVIAEPDYLMSRGMRRENLQKMMTNIQSRTKQWQDMSVEEIVERYMTRRCKVKMETNDAVFVSAVSDSLETDGFVIIYVCYAGGAGAEDYFFLDSKAAMHEVIHKIKAWDSVSVFTDKAIPIKGQADDAMQDQTRALLSRLQTEDSDECVIAVRRDADRLRLIHREDWLPLYSTANRAVVRRKPRSFCRRLSPDVGQ